MNPLDHPLFEFGRPPNLAAWLALGLAFALWVWPRKQERGRWFVSSPRMTAGVLGLVAATLSAAYFIWVLGGGPRIIDATAYLCAARIFESGSFTFHAPAPSALFHSRFLIHPPDSPDRFGVIFPPGYPALLALFERLGDYRWAGPCLAFALTLTTFVLACELMRASGRSEKLTPWAGLLAALLSLSSATLRYHTADTMSHGWSALLTASAGVLVVRSWTRGWTAATGLALGLALGFLIATRPLTGLTLGLVLGVASLRSLWRARLSPVAGVALGLVPGILLLLAHQKALTGSFWDSTQLRYYALADGPAGCFRLGFGAGCEFEHGDVVLARGTLGPHWALLNSLHRLHNHSLDLANFEPLFLFLLVRAFQNRSEPGPRLMLSCLLLLTASYSLFYFDGSYPGGGARFLVELLPLEQALLAVFALEKLGVARTLALSCLGFALHGSFSQEALRMRDGGAPFLDSAVLEPKTPRVIFVESDHAFLSGLLPRSLERSDGQPRLVGPLVARRSHDPREALLALNLDSHENFVIDREPPGARLSPWTLEAPSADDTPLMVESERDYPPLRQAGLWVHPAYIAAPCVPSGRALAIRFQPEQKAGHLSLWFDGLPHRSYRATPHYWTERRGCFPGETQQLSSPGELELLLTPAPEQLFLDRVELATVDSEEGPEVR